MKKEVKVTEANGNTYNAEVEIVNPEYPKYFIRAFANSLGHKLGFDLNMTEEIQNGVFELRRNNMFGGYPDLIATIEVLD